MPAIARRHRQVERWKRAIRPGERRLEGAAGEDHGHRLRYSGSAWMSRGDRLAVGQRGRRPHGERWASSRRPTSASSTAVAR